MLPEYSYARPLESVSERIKNLYTRDSLILSQRQRQFKQSDLIRRSCSQQNHQRQYQYEDRNLTALVANGKAAKKYMLQMQKTDEELGYQTSLQQYQKLPTLLFKSTQSLEQYAKNYSQRAVFLESDRQNKLQLSFLQKQNNDTFKLLHGGPCKYRGAPVLQHELARSKTPVTADNSKRDHSDSRFAERKYPARRRAGSTESTRSLELRNVYELSPTGYFQSGTLRQ